ncbi:MAG: serine/threonine-protein kinase [bacterium]
MNRLSDETLAHLRDVTERPELPGDRYEIHERLGRGGMGTVWRATDRELARDVAIKVMTLPAASARERSRLQREAHILARLEHPGIVPIHDIGELADGRLWYAMKLVRGEALDRAVETVPALPARLRLFLRLCETVEFAHVQGVIHRDLKPANVMVGPFGEVLVMDWGVAKVLGELEDGEPGADPPSRSAETPGGEVTDSTSPGTILGTPGWMAPEQAAGRAHTVDPRADVFGLGRILHALVGPEPPRRLAAIVARAEAGRPEDRYGSAAELAADIDRFLSGTAVSAYREGALEKLGRLVERHRVAILLLLAYVAMRSLLFLWGDR